MASSLGNATMSPLCNNYLSLTEALVMACTPKDDSAIPEQPTRKKNRQVEEREESEWAIDLVSIDRKTLNFSNENQTVDNIDIKWPPHHELLTRLPIDRAFFVDVDKLDEHAILKIGIFVPQDNRVCPILWAHSDTIDPRKLHGTVWYWNLKDVRKKAISTTTFPTTLRTSYGNKCDVKVGSSVGAYRDPRNGSLHFVVDNRELGVAVERISRNWFYGWIRIGSNGTVKITHRVDLSIGYHPPDVLNKEPAAPLNAETKVNKPAAKTKKKKKSSSAKTKKEKEKEPCQSTQDEQVREQSTPSASSEERTRKAEHLHVYRMTQKPRGHCLIISNSTFFDPSQNRGGADADEKALKFLFEELHFKVTIKRNLKAKGMDDQLHAFARIDHSQFDAFVCVIMTHGRNDSFLLGVDESVIKLEDLMSAVKPTNCKSLQGKPKFFIVQACRGELREDVANSYCPASFASNCSTFGDRSTFHDDGHLTLSTDSTLARTICPIEGDFLLAFATTPGYVALRDTKKGSIFVQVLVDVFRKLHSECHAVELLTEVNRQVSEKVEELSGGVYWQIPGPSFTLRGAFYL